MTDFQAFNATTHPIIRLEGDWNSLLDHGLVKPCAFLVRVNGSYYEALSGDSGMIAYGGVDNAGGTDGTSANAVLQAAITNADGGQVNIQKGTYPDLALDIVIPSSLFAELGTIFQSSATDYALTVGDGVAQVANDTSIHGILFEPYDSTAYGGIHVNGPVKNAVMHRCHFRQFSDETEYAVKQENSWEIYYHLCRFWDTQHDLLLDGTGYAYTQRCYFNANDYGAKGTTYNYGIYAKNGSVYSHHDQFETNSTTGVAFRSDFPGNNRFFDSMWESGENLRAIWRTAAGNYADYVFGMRPDDLILGMDVNPALKLVDGKTLIPMAHGNVTEDDDGGTATIAHYTGGAYLATQNVTGQHAALTWTWGAGAGVGSDPNSTYLRQNPEFDLYIYLSSVADVDMYLAWGQDASTITNKHFGLKVVDTDLYFTSGDGVAGSLVDTAENVAATTWYHLRLEYKIATIPYLRLMINGDDITTHKTTNLPDWSIGGNYLFFLKIQTGADAVKQVNFTWPELRYA